MRSLFLFLLLAGPALASPGETLTLHGEARIAGETRPVRFTFLCSSHDGPQVTGAQMTGVMGVDLIVPRHDTLRPIFDFDPFEGPDARAGALTRLETTAEAASGSLSAMVSGSIGVEDDAPFVFSAVAARRRDAARLAELARVLAPLTTGPAQLSWTQGQTRAGAASIAAQLEVSAADAERLKGFLAPCLGR